MVKTKKLFLLSLLMLFCTTVWGQDSDVKATDGEVDLNKVIYYTTTDGQPLGFTVDDKDNPSKLWGKNADGEQILLIEHNYANGQGTMVFSENLKGLGTLGAESGPFQNKKTLQTITIPSSATFIGGYVFYGDSLLMTISVHGRTSGDISTVTKFGAYAFYHCALLTNITFSENISEIDIDAFNGCKALHSNFVFACDNLVIEDFAFISSGVSSVEFKGKNINVDLEAFEWCPSLGSVKTTGEGSLSSIAAKAFENSSTTDVDLNVTGSIGNEAFLSSADAPQRLTSVKITNCTSIGEDAFKNNSNLSSVTIEGNSCTIDREAFMGCSGLLTATIKNCTSIGEKAFYGLKQLHTVNIEGSTSIGEYAFELCDELANVTLGNCTEIKRGALSVNPKLTSIVIPASCRSIGHSAFYGTGLTSLTLNEGLESVGEQAFASGLHIANLVIPASVTNIQYQAFQGCTDIKTVIFKLSTQDGVEKFIGNSAFSGCSGLKYVVLPKTLKRLGWQVFDGCTALEKVFFISSQCPELSDSIIDTYDVKTPFRGMPGITDVYVPVGSKVAYRQAFTDAKVFLTNSKGNEVGDLKAKKLLGWTLIQTNTSGYSSFGGSCDEGDGVIKDHRWDFQSYQGLLDDVQGLGLSDIKDLEIYSCVGWRDSTYTENNEQKHKTVVRFDRMRVNNASGPDAQIYNLPKGAGVLLYNTLEAKARRFGILETPDSVNEDPKTNYMKSGKGEALTTDGFGQFYVFGSRNGRTGFYKLGANVVVPAGKAYLDLTQWVAPTSQGVKSSIIFEGFNEEEVTAIEDLLYDGVTVERPGVMYNLSGQQITEPHGVYIMNGKKYFAK